MPGRRYVINSDILCPYSDTNVTDFEILHLNWTERSITLPPWKTTAARLAVRARSPVVLPGKSLRGRLLGFNVDPSFSHALDALILADLRTAPLALLERCMGRRDAKAFLERQQPVFA